MSNFRSTLTSIPQNEVLPNLRRLKKLIVMYSSFANLPWVEVNVQVIFSRVQSLEFLYTGQTKASGAKWCEYNKWARESVCRGDMEPKEEVLTHFVGL